MMHGRDQVAALYVGDRIERAMDQSHIDENRFVKGRSGLLQRLSRLNVELQNLTVQSLRWERTVVRGRESSTGEPMTIHFLGSTRIVDFCASHILGNADYSVETGRQALRGHPPDLIVDHHRLRMFFFSTKNQIILPGRVNQYLPLKNTWSDTLESLPTKHRNEVKRVLRKKGFTVAVCQGQATVQEFYEKAYVPYANFRFGGNASISDKRPFLEKHKDAVVLWLYSGSVPVGANIVRWQDDTLRIEQCGLTAGNESMTGVFDTLDYFSLLLAQLLKCRELDFGGSRPHIKNGIFRYKAKWTQQFRIPNAPAPKIRIRIVRDSAAVRGFLKHNFFLQIVDKCLRIKVLIDDDAAERSDIDKLVKDVGQYAVDNLLLISASADKRSLAAARRVGIQVKDLSGLEDVTRGYLASDEF